MAKVGDSALLGYDSYLGIGREEAYGTLITTTAYLDFLSSSLKTVKDSKILEEVSSSRTYANQLRLGTVIEGDFEFYLKPENTATGFILQSAFGGSVTTATVSAGSSFTHTFKVGAPVNTYTSLSFNMRKGATTTSIFEYYGLRPAELGIVAELDEAVKMNVSLIGKGSSLTANDISAQIAPDTSKLLSFTDGRLSVEDSYASLTSSNYWQVQSINFNLSNNLKSDTGSRRIGSDTLEVLPYGIASFEVSASMRFDTLTAYNSMIANTEHSLELEFLGDSLSGSITRQGLRLEFPKVFIKDAGDPEIGGPDEVLTAEVTFDVLRDASSAGGYAMQAILTSDITAF